MPHFKFVPEVAIFDPGPLPQIDKSRKTAVYIRQSDRNADTKNGESRETQLKLKDFAMQLRGDQDISGVKIYDEKAGRSGTLDTHKRPELQRLWNDIDMGLVATVIVARLDRLYRDDIGDQYGAFMRLAKEQNVIVIVPAIKEGQQHKYYDLRDRDHRKAFRAEMEKAGSYIPENIAYLHKCRQQKRAKGYYSGGNLPPGLALDKSHNPENWKPVIYEPWARVMRQIFERAKELNWNFALLIRELKAQPFVFPDIPDEDKTRFYVYCTMNKVEKGYKPSLHSIRRWFTCLTLAGHWKVDEIHIKPNNHPAVIDPTLFEEGYIHMIGEDLQGNPVGKKKRAPKERATAEDINLVLRSILTCPKADFISNIKYVGHDDYIAMKMETTDKTATSILKIHGPGLDAIVRERLVEWSEADNTLADRIKAEFQKAHEQQIQSLSSVKASLVEAQLQKARLETRMAKPTVTDELYAKLEGELVEVVAKIGKLQADIDVIEKIKGTEHIDRFYHILKNVRERYERMSLSEKQMLWQLLTEEVKVEAISPHWIKLTISWIAPVTTIPDIAYIWRRCPAHSGGFSPEEEALLREVYPKIKRKSELLKLFPDRTYSSLRSQACRYTFAKGELQSIRTRRLADVDDTLCWLDALAIPDQEVSLAMAHEAIVACEPRTKDKEGKQLYAIWCMSALAMSGDSELLRSEIEEAVDQSYDSSRPGGGC